MMVYKIFSQDTHTSSSEEGLHSVSGPLPTLPSTAACYIVFFLHIGGSWQINASGIQSIEPKRRITDSARLEQSFEVS